MHLQLELMRRVARRLEALDISFAFVGGSILCLLVDNPELTEIRTTDDVDVIVEVVTKVQLYELEDRLRAVGFKNDTSEDAPICRWMLTDTGWI